MIRLMEKRVDKAPKNNGRAVWLLTIDPKTIGSVRAALQGIEGLAASGVCSDLQELTANLERLEIPAVVVDIDAEPSRMLHELEPIITRFTHTRFVVLSSRFSNELILEAMQAGARHFVLKQAIDTDLPGVLRRLTSGPGRAGVRAEERGEVITILSGGGGCGATTLAVNLANEMHLLTSAPALVVDMDPTYGSVATYLGLGGEFGVADVMNRYGALDPQLIRTTALAFSEGLHALISPASVNFSHPAELSFEQVEEVLMAFKRAYARTVIDAPRLSMDAAARLASGSCCTLIIGQLCVKDIRTARAISAALVERGVPAHTLKFVAGRYTKRGMLSRDDAEKGLGGLEMELICNDFRSANHSMNVGEPLAKVSPRSGLRLDIQRLASAINSRLPRVQSFTANTTG
jgi:pilus assembly protein CpaE